MTIDAVSHHLMEEFAKSAGAENLSESKQFDYFCTHTLVAPATSGTIDFPNVVTDGGDDAGIDAAAIIINEQLITDIDLAAELLETNRNLDVQFIFIQATTSSSYSASKFRDLVDGVSDFVSADPRLPRNDAIQNLADIAQLIINSPGSLRDNPSCHVYYCYLGRLGDLPNKHQKSWDKQTDSLRDLNLFSDELSVQVLDARQLQKKHRNLIHGTEREFNFEQRVTLPPVENVVESHLGHLPAEELLKLLEEDDRTLSSALFYENIRDYQGNDNPVNNEMLETLASPTKNQFALMNNGVTIIAKYVRQTGDRFSVKDFQVVNGCQTTHALWQHRTQLDGVSVPVRLIATEDENVIADIIRATNRQTEVKEEQFFASSDTLKHLEQYFSSQPTQRALYLERRLKQHQNSNVERTRVVPFSALVRSFASLMLAEPHRVTRNYKALHERIPDEILNPDHQPAVYFAAASALYRLEFFFRNGTIDRSYSPAKWHLLLASRLEIQTSRPQHLNSKQAASFAEKLIDAYWDPDKSSQIFNSAANCIYRLADGDIKRDRIRTAPFTQSVLEHYQRDKRSGN